MSLCIALADDHHGFRRVLATLLERGLGHKVVCQVDNGRDLLAACLAQHVDLAIIDLDMPILDGLATAEQLSLHAKLPIILLSGHPDLNHVVTENEPIAICLTKPVSIEQLDDAIKVLFKRPSLDTCVEP